MQPTRKSEITELYKRLYHSTSPDKDYILQVLRLSLEGARDKFMAATDTEQMLRLQGEARVLDKVLREMTTAPPTSQE